MPTRFSAVVAIPSGASTDCASSKLHQRHRKRFQCQQLQFEPSAEA